MHARVVYYKKSIKATVLGLEVAARIAGHESTLTTQLYNRVQEEISLDEIGRIHIWAGGSGVRR